MDSSHDSNSNLESEDSSLEEVGGQLDLAFNGEDSTEDVPEDDGSPPAKKRRGKAKRYQFHSQYANKAEMDDDDDAKELFKDMYQHDRQATKVGRDHIWISSPFSQQSIQKFGNLVASSKLSSESPNCPQSLVISYLTFRLFHSDAAIKTRQL